MPSNTKDELGLLLTTGDLKALVIPLAIALIRTFWRLKDEHVFDIAKKVRQKRTLYDGTTAGNVGMDS